MTFCLLRFIGLGVGLGAGLAPALAAAAPALQSHTVRVASGTDTASVEGSTTGNGPVDDILGARADQTIAASPITDGGTFCNILSSGSDGVAISNGSMDGNDATGVTLPATGDHRMRVYLVGSAWDSGKNVPFQLSMTIL